MTSVWILLLTFSVLCTEISWDQYKQEHKLNFDDAEEDLRRKIFEENVQYIEAENAKGHSYKLGINHFAHWTDEEYSSILMTPTQTNVAEKQDKLLENDFSDDDEKPLEEEINENLDVDWRKNGYVTEVKDQGRCAVCYAFASVANLESAYAMRYNFLRDLSVQQVLDCSQNNGCLSGTELASYDHLIHFGDMSWLNYQYKGYKKPCRYDGLKVVAKPKNYVLVKGGKDSFLVRSVTKRPTTVRMRSDIKSFKFYSSGIYNDPECTPKLLQHVAVVVGVVENPKDKYFIVKNSWGKKWGIEGYMYLSRETENLCGVTEFPTYLTMP